MASEGETIFALATPPGKSAVAVIRISGPQARTLPEWFAAKCPPAGEVSVAKLKHEDRSTIDQVMLLFMV